MVLVVLLRFSWHLRYRTRLHLLYYIWKSYRIDYIFLLSTSYTWYIKLYLLGHRYRIYRTRISFDIRYPIYPSLVSAQAEAIQARTEAPGIFLRIHFDVDPILRLRLSHNMSISILVRYPISISHYCSGRGGQSAGRGHDMSRTRVIPYQQRV